MNPLFNGFYPRYRHHEDPPVSAEDTSISAIRTNNVVRDLEDRIDKLSMICCAMWTIVQAHTDVDDEALVRLVQELDLSDGELDGKARIEQVTDCASCRRPVALRHLRCMYCGHPRTSANPFEEVL